MSTAAQMRNAPVYTAAQRCEAAEWFVLIRESEDPSAETLHAWMHWLEASAGNRLAFEAVERAWHQTPPSLVMAMPTAQELAEDDYDGAMPVSQWPRAANKPKHLRRVLPLALAAAALVAAVLLGRPALEVIERWRAPAAGEFVTRTGEDRDFLLADGSRVWLGAKSRLVVSFSEERRSLRLEAGEAYFSVNKDLRRPFTVHAQGGVITALGTAFNVRTVDRRVVVAVTEGVVSVSGDAGPREHLRLRSGQQLVFDAAGDVPARPASASTNDRSRWRDGWLVYRNEPLRDVIADVARYTERRIEVSDEVADLRFSGAVHREDIAEWIFALPESFPVSVRDGEETITVTSRRPAVQ